MSFTYKQIKKGMKFKGIPGKGKHEVDTRIFTVVRKQKNGTKRIVWVNCAWLPIPSVLNKQYISPVDLDFTMGELNHYLRQIPKETKGFYIEQLEVGGYKN